MDKYGQAAIKAVKLINLDPSLGPNQAWENSTLEIFGKGSTQKKSCPRGTFLGLCEAGKVKGVKANNYTRSALNKRYGIDALKLLNGDPSLANNKKGLWEKIPGCNGKSHNSQMDVVLALWGNNHINH